jgi:hypothetical protein
MSKQVCTVCKNGWVLNPALSNRQNATNHGISEGSIRRHKKHSVAPTVFKDEHLEDLGIPSEYVTSRGKSTRLLDGSWEKVTWRPNAVALHQALVYDDLAQALAEWEWKDHADEDLAGAYTDVLNMADLQIGKAMQRGGGTPETVVRVRQSVQTFANRLMFSSPEAAVIVDNGDPIENCFNVPSQLVTNDLDVPAQIRTFRRLMIETIKTLAPLVPKLYYVSVPSNHGAHRTGYKAPGGTTDADFGLEISHQIEDAVQENDFLRDRVVFVRPDPLEETATVTVSNTKLAFHHGHQSNSDKAFGLWWAKQDHGRRPGWDADILVTAHFHNMGLEQSGDGRWIIKCASSDGGSQWYTDKSGETALPGMTAFRVQDGKWSDLALL